MTNLFYFFMYHIKVYNSCQSTEKKFLLTPLSKGANHYIVSLIDRYKWVTTEYGKFFFLSREVEGLAR